MGKHTVTCKTMLEIYLLEVSIINNFTVLFTGRISIIVIIQVTRKVNITSYFLLNYPKEKKKISREDWKPRKFTQTLIACSKLRTFLLTWFPIIPASILGSIISMADMASNRPKLRTKIKKCAECNYFIQDSLHKLLKKNIGR